MAAKYALKLSEEERQKPLRGRQRGGETGIAQWRRSHAPRSC